MAIPDEVPRGSLEYVSVVLLSDDDLTTGGVQIGLSTVDGDLPTTWLPAGWPTPGVNEARTTDPVDTGTLAPGFYVVWARVVDSPEVLPRPYGMIRIVAATGADLSDVAMLRRLTDELTDSNFGDAFLADLLASNGGDVNKTASAVWSMKAAASAGLVDVTESGSSRKLSDVSANALAMSKYLAGAGSTVAEAASGVTRVRQIQRPKGPNP